MRPRSIVLFEKVYLASIVLGLVGLALSWTAVARMARAQAGAAAPIANGLLITGTVVSVLVPLLLLYFVARRASKVAKWIVVALTALGVYFFVSGAIDPATPKGLLLLLGAINTVLTVYAAWLLFRPDAKAWLDRRGANGSSGSSTIE